MSSFSALVLDEADGKIAAEVRDLADSDLPPGEVTVAVSYSTLNYKDGMVLNNIGGLVRNWPHVPGIDFAGTVVESSDGRYAAGDAVLLNGWRVGEAHWGGYAQKQKLKAEWLVRLPEAFSLEEAMAIGTAGYTAMLCVLALQDWGVKPDDGPIVVTGAAGGVGTVAIMLLAKLGYEVTASTGRVDEARPLLEALGAKDIIARDQLARDPGPLEAETWAGAVDTVGDNTLASVLAQTRYEGMVTACGLAGSTNLPASVMPFILRGVTLRGIDSVMAPLERRQRAWDSLAELVDLNLLRQIYSVEPLSKVPALAGDILAGKVKGRVVIDVNA